MPDDKDNLTPAAPRPGMSKDEVALELMRFITVTTGFGKTSMGAGFGGKGAPKTPEEQVDAMIHLFERCKTAVGN